MYSLMFIQKVLFPFKFRKITVLNLAIHIAIYCHFNAESASFSDLCPFTISAQKCYSGVLYMSQQFSQLLVFFVLFLTSLLSLGMLFSSLFKCLSAKTCIPFTDQGNFLLLFYLLFSLSFLKFMLQPPIPVPCLIVVQMIGYCIFACSLSC